MKYINTIAALGTLSFGATAFADLGSLTGQDTLRYYESDGQTATGLADASYAVLDLYVKFDAANTHGYSNSDTRLLNVLDANFSASGFSLFNQSDLTVGGSWKPSFSFDIPGAANSNIDSFVTLGGGVGALAATNITTPDPNLGAAENADIFNSNVGWFLNPPTSTQGDVDGDLKVWIGRFVVSGDEARAGAGFAMNGSVGYNYGEGTGAYFGDMGGDFIFTPAPGAIALMGLAGVVTRRRRA